MKAKQTKKPRENKIQDAPIDTADSAGAQQPRVAGAGAMFRRLGWATIAGCLIFLSFPRTTSAASNITPLVWLAFVPLLWALRGTSRRQGFWLGAWAGLVTNFGGFWWISEVLRDFGHLPDTVVWPLTVVNAFYQGLTFALFGYLYRRFTPRSPSTPGPAASGSAAAPGSGRMNIFAIAAIFTLIEFFFPMLFPWYLGNSQYRFLPAIQLAELTGVMGVTFIIVVTGAALYRLVERLMLGLELPRKQVALGLSLAVINLGYGVVRVMQVDDAIATAETVRVGLVEADIGIWEKQAKHLGSRERHLAVHGNLLLHQRMSQELAEAGVDLVIWPESSYYPVDSPHIKRTDRFALGLAADGRLSAWRHVPFMSGAGPAVDGGLAAAERGPDGFGWSMVAPRVLEGAGADAGSGAGAGAGSGAAAPPVFVDIAADGEDGAWLLGSGGLWRYGADGAKRLAPPGAVGNLKAVASVWKGRGRSAASRVVVVGDGGTIIKGDAGGLAAVSSGIEADLNAVTLTHRNLIVAVGDGAAIVEIEAGKVRRPELPPGAAGRRLSGVTGASPGAPSGREEVVAVGQGGLVLRRGVAGARAWSLESTPTARDLFSVAQDTGGRWVAVGAFGTIIVRGGGGGGWKAEFLPLSAAKPALRRVIADGRGRLLVADAQGGVWTRDQATAGAGKWRRVQAAGLGPLVAMATVPYVPAYPMPRDVLYVYQGQSALPTAESFKARPMGEMRRVPSRDRTAVQRGFDTAILYGGISWEPAPAGAESRRDVKYNTAFMLDEVGRVIGTYDKNYLLAFGEYMPFGETFPGLYDAFPNTGHFTPGDEVQTFDWRGYRIGVMICYEDIMAKFTSRLAAKDPNLIVNVTNDAWFGHTPEPYLHLALAIFRAVENRRVLIRSTNTGVSAVIDPTGRITGQTRMDDAETLISTVPMMTERTLYSRVGDLFSYLLLAGLALYRWRTRPLAVSGDPTGPVKGSGAG